MGEEHTGPDCPAQWSPVPAVFSGSLPPASFRSDREAAFWRCQGQGRTAGQGFSWSRMSGPDTGSNHWMPHGRISPSRSAGRSHFDAS